MWASLTTRNQGVLLCRLCFDTELFFKWSSFEQDVLFAPLVDAKNNHFLVTYTMLISETRGKW